MHFSPPPPGSLGWAAVRFKVVNPLLLIYCFMYLPSFVAFVLVCITLFFLVLQSSEEQERAGCFAFIIFRKSCYCICSGALHLFLMVPFIGLQCMIVVFPDHAHLPFGHKYMYLL